MAQVRRVLRRRWPLVLLPVLLIVVIPIVVLATGSERYRAEGTVTAPSNDVLAGALDAGSGSETTSAEALAATARAFLAGEQADRLLRDGAGAAVEGPDGANVIIAVEADGARDARVATAGLLKAVVREHRRTVRRTTDAGVAALERSVEELQADGVPPSEMARARTRLGRARALAEVDVAEAAAVRALGRPDPARRVDAPPLAALAAGLFVVAAAVAAGLVLLAERLDRTVRDELDVRDTTGRPVLAVVEGR